MQVLGSPTMSATVGKRSTVPAGYLVTRGLITRGHSMIPGTRSPPSYTMPLFPRSPPTVSGLMPGRPPLSLLNTTIVSSAIPASRSFFRIVPTARSSATSSP